MNSFLTPKQEIEYKRLHKACKKIKHADRIKAILMLNKGYSFTEVAEILLVDDDTIRTWYGRYLDGGTEDLLEDHHIGGFSFLTCEQKEELCEHLRAYTYLRAADICIHVEETYKVCYTVKGMQALLKHMGFSYKKPKHVLNLNDFSKTKT